MHKVIERCAQPQLLRPIVGRRHASWFRWRAEVESLDPLYLKLIADSEIERFSQAGSFYFGGSDAVQIALQLPRSVHMGRCMAALEVNFLANTVGIPIVERFGSTEISEIEPWRLRPAFERISVLYNCESTEAWAIIGRNARSGRFLTQGIEQLTVPIKHGVICGIDPNGTASLYFRTRRDADCWSQRLLTLPDPDRLVTLIQSRGPFNRLNDSNILQYALTVSARVQHAGWRWCKQSLAALRLLAKTSAPFARIEAKEIAAQNVARAGNGVLNLEAAIQLILHQEG